MNYFLVALQMEGLKIYKSKVIWMTAVAFTIAPFMAGFFMFILKSPELANRSGLTGAKAQLVGEVSWSAYINLHAQMIAVGGIFVFGFVTSWIFGREYADNTVKDLLVLPFSRAVLVLAKFIAAIITNLILTVYIVLLGFLIGWIIGIPQWSQEIILDGMYVLVVVTVLTIILSTPVAFLATYSRGFLVPLGFVFMTLVLSQIIGAVGFGAYFPWAIPAIFSGVTEGQDALGWINVLIIFITSLLGVISTLYYYILVDQ